MLTVEIKVNGQMIGHCYCQNVTPELADDCEYNVVYYRVGNVKVKKFKIVHKESDGAEILIRKVFEKLCLN